MQSQLSNYKETALHIHSLRADVQSLSAIFDRKVSTYASYPTFLMAINQRALIFVSLSRQKIVKIYFPNLPTSMLRYRSCTLWYGIIHF